MNEGIHYQELAITFVCLSQYILIHLHVLRMSQVTLSDKLKQ